MSDAEVSGKGRRRWLELWEMWSCRREQQHLVKQCNHCQTTAQREWLRNKLSRAFSPPVIYSCRCLSWAESNWKPEGKGTQMCHPQRSAWCGKELHGEESGSAGTKKSHSTWEFSFSEKKFSPCIYYLNFFSVLRLC